MRNKKTIEDLQIKSKRCLVRCDFNVPLIDGKITDETRIVASLPTIKKLMHDGARVILCSHLGIPGGVEKDLSLAPVAKKLSAHLGKEVVFAADEMVVGESTRKIVAQMQDGDVILLENTRFRKEEMKNDDGFSQELASLADVYINDAFGTAHKAHCSTVGVARHLKESAVGYLMQKELDFLVNAVENPKRSFVAIIGGKKVSDKINVINNLLEKVDTLLIGGGMAYTFLKALGHPIGTSILEEDKIVYANEMIQKAKNKGVKLLLPVDIVIAKELKNDTTFQTVVIASQTAQLDATASQTAQLDAAEGIKDGWCGVDIGEKTRTLFIDALSGAKTIFWNGPMGVFELSSFAGGTHAIAKTLANHDATTIIGGGDTVAAVNQMGFGGTITHISTGGGASLELLEGKELPGIAAVCDK